MLPPPSFVLRTISSPMPGYVLNGFEFKMCSTDTFAAAIAGAKSCHSFGKLPPTALPQSDLLCTSRILPAGIKIDENTRALARPEPSEAVVLLKPLDVHHLHSAMTLKIQG